MQSAAIEWARVAPDTVIIASGDRAWIQPLAASGPFMQPMRGAGSVSTTRALLDAAVRAGHGAPGRGVPREITPLEWAYRLCDMYQTTHATPPLMLEAAARFEAAGRTALARWARAKAEEEASHDDLALRDLDALGYDASALVASVVPEVGAALVGYFTSAVRAADPIGCVGYAYALERLALEIDESHVTRVEAAMPPGVRATRCLRVHCASGSDRRHVREAVEVVSALSADERAAVARAAYETAALCARRPDAAPAYDIMAHRRTESLSTPTRI